MRPCFAGLWRHPDFLRLWAGQIVSAVGNQVGALALPLLAIIALHADARQMGLLRAAERAPFLLLALVVGVWVDRRRRRPLLIAADLGRAAIIGAVAAGGIAGRLTLRDLYAAAFLVGVLTVCFDVGYQSYFPGLVGRARLVEGNSIFVVSGSLVRIAGPGLAGALVQVLTAPLALLVDTLSFVVSALSLGAIRAPEPAPPAPGERRRLWAEIGEGLRLILSTPLLWANAACRATLVFSGSMVFAVYLLYLNRALGLAPAAIGAILAAGGPSSLLAGALAGRLARSARLGWVLVGAAALAGAGNLLLPLASGPPRLAVPLLVAAGWVAGCCGTLYDLLQVSLRQAITPTRLLGRMTATARFVILGATPLGALAGGLLGDALGLRATLLVGAVGSSLAFLWLLCSPVRKLDTMPAPLAEVAAPDRGG